MTNEYVMPEVIEIGEANELILGQKFVPDLDEMGEVSRPDGDLDD